MTQSKREEKSFLRLGKAQNRSIVFAFVFAVLGTSLVWRGSAATPTTSVETENGVINSRVQIIQNAAASGGSAIQFDVASLAVGSSGWIDRIVTTSSGANEIFPHGVPSDWDWAQGSQVPNAKPAGFSAFVGWGELYLSADGTATPTTFDITNFRFWMQTSTGWQAIQQGSFSGAAYYEDFSGDSSVALTEQAITNGLRIGPIPAGRTYHWFFDSRATVPADYTGNFVIAFTVKQNGSGKYGAAAGGDWWQTLSAPYPNNAAIGQGRMMKLADGAETLIGYTNMTQSQLSASHP